MGSPYNVCDVVLKGEWRPELPDGDWQDRYAQRGDGLAVALVRWDTPGNEPGFRIYAVDAAARTVHRSKRFPGCCEALEWTSPEEIHWTSFPDLQGSFTVPQHG